MISNLIKPDYFKVIACNNQKDWLNSRGIGGSSAAVILGVDQYKTKRDLYDDYFFTGERVEIDNRFTRYGKAAEPLLRKLFALDYPEYEVYDPSENPIEILQSIKYPFMTATLDGVLVEKITGRLGILEIKTCEVNNANKSAEWDDQIPQKYYVQILHYLLVTGYDFVIVCYQLTYPRDGEKVSTRKIRRFERNDLKDDLDYLLSEEIKYYNDFIKTKKRPEEGIFIKF